jgi:dsDNA-binding SOS-regulon protein
MKPIETSATLGKLALALAKAQGKMSPAPKDKENPYYKSHYADLGSVIAACREPLAENELALVQFARVEGGQVTVQTRLLHSSDEFIACELSLPVVRQGQGGQWIPASDPQSIGSAITYGRRYALGALLAIATEEDDDGEGAMKGHREAETNAMADRAAANNRNRKQQQQQPKRPAGHASQQPPKANGAANGTNKPAPKPADQKAGDAAKGGHKYDHFPEVAWADMDAEQRQVYCGRRLIAERADAEKLKVLRAKLETMELGDDQRAELLQLADGLLLIQEWSPYSLQEAQRHAQAIYMLGQSTDAAQVRAVRLAAPYVDFSQAHASEFLAACDTHEKALSGTAT